MVLFCYTLLFVIEAREIKPVHQAESERDADTQITDWFSAICDVKHTSLPNCSADAIFCCSSGVCLSKHVEADYLTATCALMSWHTGNQL